MEMIGVKTNIVIYYGRFQPPHILHVKVYEHLLTKFDNVYIGMTDKIDKERSPLSFDDRKYIWKTLCDVEDSHILKISKMYSSLEIKDTLSLKEEYHYICAISEKDSDRLVNGKYYLPYKDNIKLELSNIAGYYYIVPEYQHPVLSENISGTHIRNLIKTRKTEVLSNFYNDDVLNLLKRKIV